MHEVYWLCDKNVIKYFEEEKLSNQSYPWDETANKYEILMKVIMCSFPFSRDKLLKRLSKASLYRTSYFHKSMLLV